MRACGFGVGRLKGREMFAFHLLHRYPLGCQSEAPAARAPGWALMLGQREFFPMEQFVLSFGENAK
jgi:hypothetical protein